MDEDRRLEELLSRAGAAWRNELPVMDGLRGSFVSRASRAGRSRSAVATVASAALVVIVLVGVTFVLSNKPSNAPVAAATSTAATTADATSGTHSPAAVSNAPRPSSSDAPDVTPVASPSADATPASGWSPAGQGPDVYATWSPTGDYVVISTPDLGRLEVLSAGGSSLASYDGYGQPVWISDGQFIALHLADVTQSNSDIVEVPAILVDAASGTTSDIDAPCCVTLGNGHGAIAAARYRTPVGGIENPAYQVWTESGTGAERDGYPMAWTRGGDKLLVLHPTVKTRGLEGWLEVVSWPSLETLFEADHDSVTAEATFNPSGEFVAYEHVTPAGDLEMHLVNLASGTDIALPIAGQSISSAWNSSNQLVIADIDSGSLNTYATDGTTITSEPLSGAAVIESSADGSALVSRDRDNPSEIRYERDGVTGKLQLPSGTFAYDALAPDGQHIFVETVAGTGRGYLAPLE
jgi:hypothetical protein